MCGEMSSEDSYKNWMGDLRPELTRIPLCSLAIPGKNEDGKHYKGDNSSSTSNNTGVQCTLIK